MTLRQRRIAKGLCPRCGAEAAPYYLCDRCTFRRKLEYFLRKAEAAGDIWSERRGREKYVGCVDRNREWHVSYHEVTDQNDRRLRPRLRGIPVDVEKELIGIFQRANKGLTIEEILEAWGTMRLRPNRTSAAADMAQIVETKRRRAAKLARRAARHRKQMAVGQGI